MVTFVPVSLTSSVVSHGRPSPPESAVGETDEERRRQKGINAWFYMRYASNGTVPDGKRTRSSCRPSALSNGQTARESMCDAKGYCCMLAWLR